jgi:small conductance mechanosensitive channel
MAFAPATASAATLVAQLVLPSSVPSDPNVKLEGTFLTAPITIDGTTIFRIAVAYNAPLSQIPIAVRQTDVQTTLSELLATTGSGRSTKTDYDPQTLRVHIVRDGDVDSLEAVDAKHGDPLAIVTITAVDARYNQLSRENLATQWQGVLQSALVRALELRQPAAQQRSLGVVARVAAALVVASLLVWALVAFLTRLATRAEEEIAERERRAQTQKEQVAKDTDDAHHERRRFLAIALRNIEPEQRARVFRALAEASIWSTVLAWFVAITWAFSLFPQTTPLADSLISGSLRVLFTIVIAGLLNRILDIVIARVASVSEQQPFANSEDRARLLLRIPTIARALGGFKTFVLVFVAALAVLGEVGVPIGSVVTIGGLAAIALSLAAQNFVRDFVNGSLVLFEDQYVVGDYVTINGASGIVEHLSLRMVQIRDAAGDVVTIPHSSVTAVSNQSRKWSRVDYRVPVDPASDVPKAIELVRDAIESIAGEAEWRGQATLPIEWIGVDAVSKDWAIVRASIRTAPLRQFEFRRELNARVIAAFAHGDVAFGAQLPGTP